MGSTYRVDKWYVRVEPFPSLSFEKTKEKRDAEYRNDCDSLAAEIREHFDDAVAAETASDGEIVCEFCGAKWTEGNAPYNGGCCDEDEENRP